MATPEDTEPEPGEPPDLRGSKEADQPGGARLRREHVHLIVDVIGVVIGLVATLRGCGG
jgi:hypothetical protein